MSTGRPTIHRVEAWWTEIEKRVRERGVRVEERLALLARLSGPDAAALLAALETELDHAVDSAVAAVRREALAG